MGDDAKKEEGENWRAEETEIAETGSRKNKRKLRQMLVKSFVLFRLTLSEIVGQTTH